MNDVVSIDRQVEMIGVVGGFAHGSYCNVCKDCESHFVGDKRAMQCLTCAVKGMTQTRSGRGRPMKPIPISAGERIAKDYGYDQVVIVARRVGESPDPHGEHCTTYGIDKVHCGVAARVGSYLQREIMKWHESQSE